MTPSATLWATSSFASCSSLSASRKRWFYPARTSALSSWTPAAMSSPGNSRTGSTATYSRQRPTVPAHASQSQVSPKVSRLAPFLCPMLVCPSTCHQSAGLVLIDPWDSFYSDTNARETNTFRHHNYCCAQTHELWVPSHLRRHVSVCLSVPFFMLIRVGFQLQQVVIRSLSVFFHLMCHSQLRFFDSQKHANGKQNCKSILCVQCFVHICAYKWGH